MLIKTDWSILRTTKWNDYAVRFFLGGTITVVAGLIAKEFGPVIGGLFLAFPAIFPLRQRCRKSARKSERAGRGCRARSVDVRWQRPKPPERPWAVLD